MPQIYGDPWQWRRIYNANRDKMPQRDNPDLIHPGMILDIPSIRGEVRSGILQER
jgi:nucleoid-associated protein YgaU